MTDRARAAVLTEFGKPLRIQEFPILDPERAFGEAAAHE
jgi:hypothetical protein